MLQQIQQGVGQLSRAERRVAEWVLAHPRQAARASIADLASAAGTSPPTVMRFCRHLGIGSFRELKVRLAETTSRPASYVHREVSATDSDADLVTKVVDQAIQSLLNVRAAAAALPLAAAVDCLHDARQIVFAGIGASGIVVEDAWHKFFRLGIPCTVARDEPTLVQLASIATGGDVFVVVSQSGQARETVAAARNARERGATVLALTAADSALAATANLLFDWPATEDTSIYTPMSSRLAQLTVLDALQVALALRLGPEAEARLRATKAALPAHRTEHDGD